MSSEANVAKAGLEGIVAAQSTISDVNGQEGKLIYAGYDIHDLAQHATSGRAWRAEVSAQQRGWTAGWNN